MGFQFDLAGVNLRGCSLDFVLLEKLNQLALEEQIVTDYSSVTSALSEVLRHNNIELAAYPSGYTDKILKWCSKRVSKLTDLVSKDFEYLWAQPCSSVVSQIKMSPTVLHDFVTACNCDLYLKYSEPNNTQISTFLESFSSTHNLKQKHFLKDLRLLLCGVLVSIIFKINFLS